MPPGASPTGAPSAATGCGRTRWSAPTRSPSPPAAAPPTRSPSRAPRSPNSAVPERSSHLRWLRRRRRRQRLSGPPHGSLTGAPGSPSRPDGRDVYVASQVGTVTRFTVSKGGRLAFAGCIGEPASRVARRYRASSWPGRADRRRARRAHALRRRLGGDALVELSVGAKGAPRLAGCFGAHERGCRSAPGPALRHLDGRRRVPRRPLALHRRRARHHGQLLRPPR